VTGWNRTHPPHRCQPRERIVGSANPIRHEVSLFISPRSHRRWYIPHLPSYSHCRRRDPHRATSSPHDLAPSLARPSRAAEQPPRTPPPDAPRLSSQLISSHLSSPTCKTRAERGSPTHPIPRQLNDSKGPSLADRHHLPGKARRDAVGRTPRHPASS
jgi:hypothetical protein